MKGQLKMSCLGQREYLVGGGDFDFRLRIECARVDQVVCYEGIVRQGTAGVVSALIARVETLPCTRHYVGHRGVQDRPRDTRGTHVTH
jgi:hypothetical protein